MKKKILAFAMAAMMLGVFGLTACGKVSLADYKATKINELQAYADAKGVDNYCTEGWQAVCKAVADGKLAIDAVANKASVDTAIDAAKVAIDAIELKEDFDLAEYKAGTKTALETYATEKGEDNYSAENWVEIQQIVVEGKIRIDAAKDKAGVDTAFALTKIEIEDIPKAEKVGVFYSIERAYNNGFITREDIKHINYFLNDYVVESTGDIKTGDWRSELNLPESEWTVISKIDFVPQMETPALDSLDPKVADDIKKLYFEKHHNIYEDLNDISEVAIVSFLGLYNGCYVVKVQIKESSTTGNFNIDGIVWQDTWSYAAVFTYETDKGDIPNHNIREKVRQDYFKKFYDRDPYRYIANDINFKLYYKAENDCVAITTNFHRMVIDVIFEKTIGGVNFVSAKYGDILVWHDGQFYNLEYAYEQDLLSQENLIAIADKFNDL